MAEAMSSDGNLHMQVLVQNFGTLLYRQMDSTCKKVRTV